MRMLALLLLCGCAWQVSAAATGTDEYGAVPAEYPGNAPDFPPADTEQQPPPSTDANTDACQEAMRRYQESVDCFESYRNQNRSLEPGAAEHCEALPQPASCSSP